MSVGGIFLLIAILSYSIPKIFVRKDVDAAASGINSIFSSYHQKVQKGTESWVTYRFLQTAAELNAVVQSVPLEEKDNWELASNLVGYSPELAFVQIKDGAQTVGISQENGKVYIPQWSRDSTGRLWIKISDTIFATSYLEDDTYLLLSNGDGINEAIELPYTPFEKEPRSITLQEAPSQIYQALKWHESVQLEKARMIRALVAKRKEAAGIVKIDSSFKRAGALLAEDIFFTKPLVEEKRLEKEPFVVFRQEGPYVDLAQVVSRGQKQVVLGFSISTICHQIAQTLQRPVLVYQGKNVLQAFDNEGENLPLSELTFTSQSVQWNNEAYTPTTIKLDDLTISVLTPDAFLQTIMRLLNQLHDSLVTKISLNLLAVALILLLLALLLLARISKKITEPITFLAQASEEIGNGKYEGLHLPSTENRHDEVAVLTRSFQKMVVSLLEREKIRGVLNKVVSKEIASKVLSGSIELGGEERILTMLFSDIRGFTPMSAKLQPRALITLLNTYMTRMCRIIDETHGVVDKFVGDEIMALYGAPLDLKNHGEKAIEAALRMIDDLKQWNSERQDRGPPITIGIGIHTGVAFSGNMGAENRLNYTVVGSNVNLAARLCSAALPMQILVSEQTYLSLPNPQKFHFEKLPAVVLKGIDQPVTVYGITSGNG